jgi:putative ABC transport system permease protein
MDWEAEPMFGSYLKIALRNLRKYKIYSLVNILGLAVGIAVCLVILVYINQEFAYDDYHEHKDQVYRVVRYFHNPNGETNLQLGQIAPPFANLIEQDFPEVERAVRTWYGGIWLFVVNDKSVEETDFMFAEEDIFDVLTIPLLAGDPQHALTEPYTAILSETFAKTLFGDENPLGQTFLMDNDFNIQVTGIFEDRTNRTHLPAQVIVSFKTIETEWSHQFTGDNWGSNNFGTYIRLAEGTNPEVLAAKFPDFLDRHLPQDENDDGSVTYGSVWTSLHLQPLPWIYMNSHLDSESTRRGHMEYTMLFAAISIVILLVACVNFMNLATARSAHRAREVGLRKVVGAERKMLIGQFLGESFIMVGISMFLAMILAELFLPYFMDLVFKPTDISLVDSWTTIPLVLSIWLIVGLLAGFYPAFYLSGYKPSSILRGELTLGGRGARSRRVLVVGQFAVSVALIVTVSVTLKQMDYIKSKELGFNTENIIRINAWPDSMKADWPLLKDRLLSHPGVLSATAASINPPVGRLLDSQGGSIEVNGELIPFPGRLADIRVDHDFLKTYGVEMAAGRDFSVDHASDSTQAFIINEAAVKVGGWSSAEEAVGSQINYGGRENGTIIGVCNDFHFESLHREISPFVFYIDQARYNNFCALAAPGQTTEVLALLEDIYAHYWPNWPFRYEFMDERKAEMYDTEVIVTTMFTWCAGFAIFIACLGLLGLAAYTAERRTKEIGIRRTLGASEMQIVALLNKEFLFLVGAAILIAWPLSWYGMNLWLEGFAYRTTLSLDLFLYAGGAALLIAMLVVTTQALRAAAVHPIKALRHD